MRNLSGIVNADGTVSLFAITGLVSAMVLPGSEAFTTIAAPTYATVYRGVTQVSLAATTAVLEPISPAVMGTSLLGMLSVCRLR